MSLVSTYVESQSGLWYRDPIVKGDGWFICWDDDDPIEIVIDATTSLHVDDILNELAENGWRLIITSKAYAGARRLFGSIEAGDFKPATAFFLRQTSYGPTDEMLGDSKCVGAEPLCQGVFYRNPTNGGGL